MATLRQIRRDNGEETGGEEEDMAPPATPTEDSLSPFFSLTDGGTVDNRSIDWIRYLIRDDSR